MQQKEYAAAFDRLKKLLDVPTGYLLNLINCDNLNLRDYTDIPNKNYIKKNPSREKL